MRPTSSLQELVPAPNTSTWYATQYGCLRTDPTAIMRRHTFPDAPLPIGVPETPAPMTKVCLQYRTAWPMEYVNAAGLVDAERQHPQFAYFGGYGPATRVQVDAESDLRLLNTPLSNCQPVLPVDAPLFRNTVAPPPAVGVPAWVQNAANPIAAILPAGGESACRTEADRVATAMSGRWVNNATRQDTMRYEKPFSPPGIGTGAPRGNYVSGGVVA
jgi:hypothetical protein